MPLPNSRPFYNELFNKSRLTFCGGDQKESPTCKSSAAAPKEATLLASSKDISARNSEAPITTSNTRLGQDEQILQLSVALPKSHPRNAEIYGDEPADMDFRHSVATYDFQEPLIASDDHALIAGLRRLKVARALGLTQVPVIVRAFSNDADKLAALLESNCQRAKSSVVLGNEAIARKQIEVDFAKHRQKQAGAGSK